MSNLLYYPKFEWQRLVKRLTYGYLEEREFGYESVRLLGSFHTFYVLSSKTVSVDPSAKGTAALLTTNTEVSIAPKLHKQADGGARSQVSKDTKTSATSSQPSSAPSKTIQGSSRITRVLPKRLLPQDAISKIDSYPSDLRAAYVSWTTFVRLQTRRPPNSLVPDPSSDDNGTLYAYMVKRLQPPVDPSSNPSTSSAAPSPPPSTVLTAGGSQEKDKTSPEQARRESEVYISWLNEIPDDHIVFRNLAEDIKEWDLIRFEATSIRMARLLLIAAQDNSSTQREESQSHAASAKWRRYSSRGD